MPGQQLDSGGVAETPGDVSCLFADVPGGGEIAQGEVSEGERSQAEELVGRRLFLADDPQRGQQPVPRPHVEELADLLLLPAREVHGCRAVVRQQVGVGSGQLGTWVDAQVLLQPGPDAEERLERRRRRSCRAPERTST